MASLHSYLNFPGNTEEAFNFYKSVFGGEFIGGIMRFKGTPESEKLSPADANKIMHVALPIGKDSMLMGTDSIESMGQKVTFGNNFHLTLTADSKEEADKLYAGLSNGGTQTLPMMDQFWGDYFGMLTDKFGIQWMVTFNKAKKEGE